MKLFVIFAQRPCEYEGQHAPEALDVWDEYARDDNPDGFNEAIEKARARASGHNPEFTSVVTVQIGVDGDAIHRLLNEAPVIRGKVEGS